jgi:hypothetical protein
MWSQRKEFCCDPTVVILTTSSGSKITGTIELQTVTPSLFTADESGGWLAADQTFIPSIATCTSNLVWNGMTWSGCVPIPINMGTSTDQVVLILFGTGIRGANALAQDGYSPVSVSAGQRAITV